MEEGELKTRWHSGRVLFALARHFNWSSNRLMTEYPVRYERGPGRFGMMFDEYFADLVLISRAGYLTEIEIKVSISDWNADRKKRKWCPATPPSSVSRFFYAVPETIEDRLPEWVPPSAGILVVRSCGRGGYDTVDEVRAARAILPRKKLSDEQLRHLFASCYYRFWNQRMDVLRRSIEKEPQRRARTAGGL